jgi:hypothetical protein
MSLGYKINLDHLCRNKDFQPSQVVSSELVFPKGAVPNAQLIWVRIELQNRERKFVTLPLIEFHEYVDLPESSIGGWTDGEVGSDIFGLDPRYAIVDPGGSDEVQDELQHSPEDAEASVA